MLPHAATVFCAAMTVLAGDIGGTNSRLAIFDVSDGGADGTVASLFEQTYPSAAHPSLDVIAESFLGTAKAKLGDRARVASACLGIAGPIENNMCRATNLPWVVDGRVLSTRLGIPRVRLVNDFYAAALGVTAVGANDLAPLGGSPPAAQGPIAVLGAGTGLGQAFLLWNAANNRYQVHPSEGGHVDFAAIAPVKAPRSWPNSSLSSRLGGIAPQSTTRNGLSRRGLPRWIASAVTSFPVPVSPSSKMVASLVAALVSTSNTLCIDGERPTMRPKRSSTVVARPESPPCTVSLPTLNAARAPCGPLPTAPDIDHSGAILDRRASVSCAALRSNS